jgi:trimethylamine-N-oxide reductase (cytochrome c)
MSQEIKTYYKGLGFCGFGVNSHASEVDVRDGKILRVRPLRFDKHYDQKFLRPWTITAHGQEFKSAEKTLIPPFAFVYKKRVYSPNRIPYPLKRVDWDPDGERNPQNRGKSKFVRISWDEATDLIAGELQRVQEKYGPYSVLAQHDGHGESKTVHASHGCQTNLLALMGGFTSQARQPDSWEGWYWGAKHVWGCDPVGEGYFGNLLWDIANHSQMVLFWGCDVETAPWGWGGQQASRYCNWLTELGIKQVYICPDVNYACAVHGDKWIPVLPNTDSALHLAIQYTWLKEDLWDQEYVSTHAVGQEEFFRYVLGGAEDGIAKTPEWAAPICGVPSRIIKALARKWHKDATSIAHCNGGSYIRSTYSHEPARLEVISLAMQGLGKPGRNQMKFIEWGLFALPTLMPAPLPEVFLTTGAGFRGASMNQWASFIPKTLIPKAILGDYTAESPLTWYSYPLAGWPREDQFVEYQYPVEGAQPLHMIWTDTPCWTTCWNGGNEMIKALCSPQIECIVAQHPWFENDCRFADIILPVNTGFEERDISSDTENGNHGLLFMEEKCVEPLGESLSDYEVVGEVAKKLGLYEAYTQGKTVDDWISHAFANSGAEKYLTYAEFVEKGYFASPTREKWQDAAVTGFDPFCRDPEANPLDTPTGKLEFYSESLAEGFPNDKERGPYPRFLPFGESHQESLLHPRSEKFPYLIVSNHPRWRVHAQMDDITWLREIETCKITGPDGYQYEPVWIHPGDAAKKAVKHGDIVKVFNDRGWVLGGAFVTERIIPGAIYQDHGARLDPIENGVSDRSGANNLICPANITSKNCPGEVTSGFLVDFEVVDVFRLAKEYPEAFNRKYDNGIGVSIDNFIVKEL